MDFRLVEPGSISMWFEAALKMVYIRKLGSRSADSYRNFEKMFIKPTLTNPIIFRYRGISYRPSTPTISKTRGILKLTVSM